MNQLLADRASWNFRDLVPTEIRPMFEVEHDRPDQDVELTGREVSLLPLLQTHLSYAEMGERLFLSVNTVKSNLQRLYRKLDVHTRREAVEAARRLGLL